MRAKVVLSVLVLCTTVLIGPADAQATRVMEPASGPGEALGNYVASEGTLNLPPGFRGSLDAHGWQLVSAENEPPRFAPLKPQDRGVGGMAALAPRVVGDERWASNFAPNGLSAEAYALAADGSGNIYVGGSFDAAGNVVVNGIARWDGSHWSSLAYGFNQAVKSLAVDSAGDLYAAGSFWYLCGDPTCDSVTLRVNSIAEWNKSSWVSVGNGLNSEVRALVLDSSGNLYASGGFLEACGNAACNSGNVRVNRVAKWNPSGGGTWSPLGNGLNGVVNALAVDSSNTVYLGGQFTNLCGDLTCATPGNPVNHVARWTAGGHWGDLSNGVKGTVNALAVDGNDNVYAGGSFQYLCGDFYCATNGTRVNYIAKWNPSGSTWSALGNGLNSMILGLAIDPTTNNLYAGGDFTYGCADGTCTIVGVQVHRVAKWDPAGSGTWSALGDGIPDAGVSALLFRAGNLYAAGAFAIAGGSTASGIALYQSSHWSALGSGDGFGPLAQVYAIAADGHGSVYVGGTFHTAGKLITSNIAKWNGSAWQALGNGLPGLVSALATDSGGKVYAGGIFESVCVDPMCASPGPKVNNIAAWNGSSWSSLAYGLAGQVNALVVDKAGNLYAGGQFWNACADAGCINLGLQVNNIARWDGSNWFPAGNGMDHLVRALAADNNDNIYVGGDFVNLCGDLACNTTGPQVNHVAEWNPAGLGAWSPLGYGVNDTVKALAVDTHNNVYAAGAFQFLCGNTACGSLGARVSRVVKWNPAGWGTWSALGNGIDHIVSALALDSADELYVGGQLWSACGDAACTGTGVPAADIAKWNPAGSGSWSALGSGVGDPGWGDTVFALAAQAGSIYVGGDFEYAGGRPSAHFGRFVGPSSLYLPLVQR